MAQQRWVQRLPPDVDGEVWQWHLTAVPQLPIVRAQLRDRLASAAQFSPEERFELQERCLLAFEELASNGLRHGGVPVWARIVAGADLLIEVSDANPAQSPEPAIGRDPALGGLGLHLIPELTAAHGWYISHQRKRKHVWACCH